MNKRETVSGTTTFSVRHDLAESLTMTIADTVAAATGRHTDDLPALYDSVAPGALDALFMPGAESRSTPNGWLTFDYADTHVTVAADDEVSVHVRTDSPVSEEAFAANNPALATDD